MNMLPRRLMFVCLSIFLVFSPSLYAEICIVDDLDMYKWLAVSSTSLSDLFLPHSANGCYYRPLIGVSYLFDKYVWLMDTRLMHLDNILFHVFNTLLVFYLTTLLLRVDQRKISLIPLCASLAFGLHPLTVESVAWISGRTDIMSCFFVLLSAVALLKYRENGRRLFLMLAPIALLPGVLFKETPLAFLPGALLILTAHHDDSLGSLVTTQQKSDKKLCVSMAVVAAILMLTTYSVWVVVVVSSCYIILSVSLVHRTGKRFSAAFISVILGAAALSAVAFYAIRKVVFVASTSSISRTLGLIAGDSNYSFQNFIGAAGFYVKKFYIPVPLDFAIREVDPLYNIFGVGVLFFCLYLLRRRTMTAAFFLTGCCLFIPALPLSLGTVTWTAYAERYIYMSTAFWSVATTLWLTSPLKIQTYKRPIAILSGLLILIMGIVTFQRNMVWKTNYTLIADTVEKSPSFKILRNDFMSILMGRNDLSGAKEQYRIATSIPSVGYMESLDINMAGVYVMEGNYAEAERLYEQVIHKTKGKSQVAYGAYISYLQERYASAVKDNDDSAHLFGDRLLDNKEKLYRLNKDPMLLYRTGQLSLFLGKRDEACRIFLEAGNCLPPKSEYALFANKLADSLCRGGSCK